MRLILSAILLTACHPQDLPQGLAKRTAPDSTSESSAGLSILLTGVSSQNEVVLSFEEIEIEWHRDGVTKWVPLLGAAKSYGVSALAKIDSLVAAELPEGYYGRVRLRIDEGWMVIGGKTYPLELDGAEVIFEEHFPIEVDRQTTVLLDFDADRSITTNEDGRMTLSPVFQVRAMSLTERAR